MWAILHGETSNSRSGRLFPSSPTLFVPGAKRSGHLCFIHGPFVHNLTSHKCNTSFNLLPNPLNLSSIKKLHGTNWPPSLQDEADIYTVQALELLLPGSLPSNLYSCTTLPCFLQSHFYFSFY